MKDWDFDQKDRAQMKTLGVSEAQVLAQIETFQRSSPYVHLHRPCTLGDGIRKIADHEMERYVQLQEEAAREGRFIKFVPASGAATRMFQTLFQIYHQRPNFQIEEIRDRADRGDPEARDFLSFQEGFWCFPFIEDLRGILARDGLDLDALIRRFQWREILEYLITERGLNCGALPKGLLKFHQYLTGSRTAFEEHLIEAVSTVRDRAGVCRLHFTISPEHKEAFGNLFERVRPSYERDAPCRFEVTFSLQTHSTDTIAVDLENRPFRERNGRLHFRPGGHGALIENLNDLMGDLVSIKNIDNILPDRLKEPTILWKKVLGGLLVEVQKKVHGFLQPLMMGQQEEGFLEKAMAFAQNDLFIMKPKNFEKWTSKERRDFLLNKLNRPLRVCGVVGNRGEPGGAPFWVEGKDGTLSLQIVENAQVDRTSQEQWRIWASSTHFNPVDLVCAVRDYEGKPFDLRRYVDREAVFISQKSKDGRELKSLELPGLWNGAMAEWITLFLEVPLITFNPVKTIHDLLRPEHQP